MSRPNSDQPKNIVKIGVTHNIHRELIELDLNQSLDTFIEERCSSWKLQPSGDYMLQFQEAPSHYITESSKHRIKAGALLNLVRAAHLSAKDVQVYLSFFPETADCDNDHHTLSHLVKVSSCPTFTAHFAEVQGFQALINLMNKLPVENPVMPTLLQVFTDLVNTARGASLDIGWDICPEDFVEKVIRAVSSNIRVSGLLLVPCLVVLENIVNNSQNAFVVVEKSLVLLQLLQHLNPRKNQNPEAPSVHLNIQKSVLALVVALLCRVGHERKENYIACLNDRKHRTYITDNVLLHLKYDAPKPSEDELEIQYLLHKLQQLLLNHLQTRLMTGIAPDDASAPQKIVQLRNVAFEADVEINSSGKDAQAPVAARRMEIKKEYKKLGFKNDNPAQDFNEVPPGILALDSMYYFCRNRSDQYSKLVLENCYRADSHECPIGKASIQLTKELAKILKIGEAPRDSCADFHPMLFTHDHPFEEMFCICIALLNKTWKEMKATAEDFSKVVRVVKDQITRALRERPANFDKFQEILQLLTYAKISEHWHRERISTEEQEMKAPQIQKLKEVLRKDIIEVVQQQRLLLLETGARFKNPNKGQKKDKYFFCRLSQNHKFFHYEECEEKATVIPSFDSLNKKLAVSDIKSLATGKDCPIQAGRRKHQFAFSLILESNKVTEPSSLDFVANDEETFNAWQDGIKVLLKEKMASEAANSDIDMLLDMEIKLQLLDVEGVTIPSQMPPVPPLPPNFNFSCNL